MCSFYFDTASTPSEVLICDVHPKEFHIPAFKLTNSTSIKYMIAESRSPNNKLLMEEDCMLAMSSRTSIQCAVHYD
jgi:hypothetical protein